MGTLRQILSIKPIGIEKLPLGFKTKWIEALRGDRYEQAIGALLDVKPIKGTDDKEEVGYCCLGVAAHVCEIGREHLIGKGTLYANKSNIWNNIRQRIPVALRDNTNLQELLIQFNDRYDLGNKEVTFNFKQIAAWIEKYL